MSISTFGKKRTLCGQKCDIPLVLKTMACRFVVYSILLNVVSNRRNSTEVNNLNQSELFHLSAIVGF